MVSEEQEDQQQAGRVLYEGGWSTFLYSASALTHSNALIVYFITGNILLIFRPPFLIYIVHVYFYLFYIIFSYMYKLFLDEIFLL